MKKQYPFGPETKLKVSFDLRKVPKVVRFLQALVTKIKTKVAKE